MLWEYHDKDGNDRHSPRHCQTLDTQDSVDTPIWYRDQGCQTPANDMRLSPDISNAIAASKAEEVEEKQEDDLYDKYEEEYASRRGDYRRMQEYDYIKEEEEEELEQESRNGEIPSPTESDDVSIIGDIMVKESLEEATAKMKNDLEIQVRYNR